MIRKKKMYKKPRQIYESERIKEENVLVKKYGLKNKREIWKTLAKVNYFRTRAKEMARLPLEEQEVLFAKLRYIGLNVKNTSDVLGLNVEALLERRLPTVVAKLKIATTTGQARQMVVHKRILVNGKVLNSPSYLVPVEFEKSISLKKKERKAKPKTEEAAPVEENADESEEEEQ
jgi:small subunit ribosomal protein S4